MSLSPEDYRHLSAAQGYLHLGLYREGNEELDKVSPEFRLEPDFLALRMEVYRASENWKMMEAAAKSLARMQPKLVQWWISWAYAARRSTSNWAARSVLLKALKIHHEVAGVHYNLACYECQIGDLKSANQRLMRAFERDRTLMVEARLDEDLKPLRIYLASVEGSEGCGER